MNARLHLLACLAACLVQGPPILAQAPCPMVKDINTTLSPFSSNPDPKRQTGETSYVKCGSHWFFYAIFDGIGGELWKTDGTAAGTVLVKDINPGTASSSIANMTCINGKLYFAAVSSSSTGLWISDGTAAGTTQLQATVPAVVLRWPSNFVSMGGKVYFNASTTTLGDELWVTDGTSAGTQLVRDIQPGTSSSKPTELIVNPSGTLIYFSATGPNYNGIELWKTDGTTAGTVMLKNIGPSSLSGQPKSFVNLGTTTLFKANDASRNTELWKTNGTNAGTVIVKDITPGSSGSQPDLANGVVIGSSIYFTAHEPTTGRELWKSDGTAAGTVLVTEVVPGTSSGGIGLLTLSGTDIYFSASFPGGYGRELCKLSAGVISLLKDINPGPANSDCAQITDIGGRVVFAADDGVSGRELWTSDGTPAGTALVANIAQATNSGHPRWFTKIAPGVAMFTVVDWSPTTRLSTMGRELWITDGTAAGTKLLKDVSPGGRTHGSLPNNLEAIDGQTVYFSASDRTHGSELWKSDASGTVMVKDLWPGQQTSKPHGFTAGWNSQGSFTVFAATDATYGEVLWVTDGTTNGTKRLTGNSPLGLAFGPKSMSLFRGRVAFAASNRTGGALWTTDGTVAGTVMLKDIDPSNGGRINELVTCGNTLYFSAYQRASGYELWSSDGTAAGTQLLVDINPGTASSGLSGLTSNGSTLVFAADDGVHGKELWATDGTVAGTRMVKDILVGQYPSEPNDLTVMGGKVYFSAHDGVHGRELWVSDMTSAGTVLVKDIWSTSGSSSQPMNLAASQDKLFFEAQDPIAGRELFVSDGTTAGTVMVRDIMPGTGHSNPKDFVAAGEGVYFAAEGGYLNGGREIWFSDGTAIGTHIVCDLWPGQSASNPKELTIARGRIYFQATTYSYGAELHYIGTSASTVEILGEGCGPEMPRLTSSNPNIGKLVTFSGQRAPAAGLRALLIGLPQPPSSLFGLVAPGCAVWENLSLPLITLQHPAGANWSLTFPMPNNASLLAVQVAVQGLYGGLPFTLSNAAQLTIGN